MSVQIAVRLPEALVDFIDEEVAAGRAKSRAHVVRKALARERRRIIAEKDAEIYAARAAAGESDPELDAIAQWSARQPRRGLD